MATPDLPTVRDQLAHAAQMVLGVIHELDRPGTIANAEALDDIAAAAAYCIADARRHLDRAEAALTRTEDGPDGNR